MAESARKGQEALSGNGTNGSRQRAISPEQPCISATLNSLSCPDLTKAFQDACRRAAPRTNTKNESVKQKNPVYAHVRARGLEEHYCALDPGRVNRMPSDFRKIATTMSAVVVIRLI